MKKIMFNDKFGLTDLVLSGRKTQTRRIISLSEDDEQYLDTAFDWDLRESVIIDRYAHYKVGDVVAVAQKYFDLYHAYKPSETAETFWRQNGSKGWANKMFVKAELMPHYIKITNIRVERLRDISDEDCLEEGIGTSGSINLKYYFFVHGRVEDLVRCSTPREAFAKLIDKVSGNGTWNSNPYVFVYDFKFFRKEKDRWRQIEAFCDDCFLRPCSFGPCDDLKEHLKSLES